MATPRKPRLSDAEMQSALANLPPLRTPEDALERLDKIGVLALRGVVPGSGAHAAGAATRTWIEVQKAAATVTRVRALAQRVDELEAELVAARARLIAAGLA